MTRSGVDKLEAELGQLIESRPDIAQKIKIAREFGDLSENSEYHAAMDEHQKTEGRIGEIEYIMKNVEIVGKPKNITEVEIGNTVDLKSDTGKKTFQVVGSVEADPSQNKISNESPLGAGLIGKKVGDKIEVGNTTYTIKTIS